MKYRFENNVWDLAQTSTISPNCRLLIIKKNGVLEGVSGVIIHADETLQHLISEYKLEEGIALIINEDSEVIGTLNGTPNAISPIEIVQNAVCNITSSLENTTCNLQLAIITFPQSNLRRIFLGLVDVDRVTLGTYTAVMTPTDTVTVKRINLSNVYEVQMPINSIEGWMHICDEHISRFASSAQLLAKCVTRGYALQRSIQEAMTVEKSPMNTSLMQQLAGKVDPARLDSLGLIFSNVGGVCHIYLAYINKGNPITATPVTALSRGGKYLIKVRSTLDPQCFEVEASEKTFLESYPSICKAHVSCLDDAIETLSSLLTFFK